MVEGGSCESEGGRVELRVRVVADVRVHARSLCPSEHGVQPLGAHTWATCEEVDAFKHTHAAALEALKLYSLGVLALIVGVKMSTNAWPSLTHSFWKLSLYCPSIEAAATCTH